MTDNPTSTDNPDSGRSRGRSRRAAGRPSGAPAPVTAVQFTEPNAASSNEGKAQQ